MLSDSELEEFRMERTCKGCPNAERASKGRYVCHTTREYISFTEEWCKENCPLEERNRND